MLDHPGAIRTICVIALIHHLGDHVAEQGDWREGVNIQTLPRRTRVYCPGCWIWYRWNKLVVCDWTGLQKAPHVAWPILSTRCWKPEIGTTLSGHLAASGKLVCHYIQETWNVPRPWNYSSGVTPGQKSQGHKGSLNHTALLVDVKAYRCAVRCYQYNLVPAKMLDVEGTFCKWPNTSCRGVPYVCVPALIEAYVNLWRAGWGGSNDWPQSTLLSFDHQSRCGWREWGN